MALGYVRPARAAEAGEIARVQLATWRTAYRRLLPRHILEEINESFLHERWLEAITAPPSGRHRVLVAIEQAAQEYLVGFLAAEPSEEDDDVAAITELLVEPRWGRRGHGSRLLAACVDLWREDGFGSAGIWAFEQDVAMQKFLTSAGWAPDGRSRALDIDDLLVAQLHLHVAIGESEQAAEADGQAGPPHD